LSLGSAIADCQVIAGGRLASTRKIANPGEQWAQLFKVVSYASLFFIGRQG